MIRICSNCGKVLYKTSGIWFNSGKCPECKGHFWCDSIEFSGGLEIHV